MLALESLITRLVFSVLELGKILVLIFWLPFVVVWPDVTWESFFAFGFAVLMLVMTCGC